VSIGAKKVTGEITPAQGDSRFLDDRLPDPNISGPLRNGLLYKCWYTDTSPQARGALLLLSALIVQFQIHFRTPRSINFDGQKLRLLSNLVARHPSYCTSWTIRTEIDALLSSIAISILEIHWNTIQTLILQPHLKIYS
jgi:hypothetical protein